MPKEGGKTEVAYKFVVCPWNGGGKPLVMEDCKACQYHKGIRDVLTNQIVSKAGKGVMEQVKVGEQVLCGFIRTLDIGCVEKEVKE